MRKFWIIISVCWLWTCGGGGGGSSPTEPQEPAPVANFTATPTTLIQGQAVTFTSTSTGTITSYAWNVDNDPAIEGTTATYEHTYTEVGTYSITLTVTGPGGSNPKTVADMITVSTAAPTPTTSTSQTVQEDGSTTISLTATDPNGQAVTFAITTDPTNGTATLSGTDITYTPNANFYGTDSFDYTASNGTYTSDPVTITITVEGEDDGDPTTNDVSATTDEDTVVTVNLDATEIDGDNYSFSIVSQPTNGTLGSVNGNQVEYTPNQDFNGTDTFTFEATDDRTGSRSNVATATITINPVNDAPVANDITSQVTDENRLMQLDITLDATDVEGDALTYSVVGTNNGTVTVNGSTATYIPNQDWNGEDTFTYKANDGTDDSNTATVTVTVNAVNDAPVTQNVSFTTDEDTPYTESYTGYVSDVDGDDLTIIAVTNPTLGTATCEGTDCTYTPYQDVHGTDSFTYKVNDGELDSNISTVSVTINPVNDAPVANDVTASTTSRTGNMRQSVDITLSVTDADGDDLTISIVSDVSNGTTSLSGSTVTYTPTANYDGTDTFTYKANDGTVDSNIATGTITITDTNQPPIANDMNISTPKNFDIIFDLDATDLDGDSISKSIISQPSNGSLLPGTALQYTYFPNDGFFGTDSFTYKVNDGTTDSDEKTVSISVFELIKWIGPVKDLYYQNFVQNDNKDNYLLIRDPDNSQSMLIEFDDNLEIINSTTYNEVDYFTTFAKYHNTFILTDFGYVGIGGGNGNVTFYDSNFNKTATLNVSYQAYSVSQNNDGDILIAGMDVNSNQGKIRKYDSNANLLLEKTFTNFNGVFDLTPLSNGQYFAYIATGQSSGQYNAILDENFNIILSSQVQSDHGIVIYSDNALYIMKAYDEVEVYDLQLNLLNSIDLDVGTPGTEQYMYLHSNGDFIKAGPNGSSGGSYFITRFDKNGNIIWKNFYEEDYRPLTNDATFVIGEASNGDLIIFIQEYISSSWNNQSHGFIKVDVNDGTKLLP